MSETITIYDDEDNEIIVTGNFIAGCLGSRNEYGAPNEPDDPSYWEIEGAEMNGVEYDLSPEQERQAEEEFAEFEPEY